MNFIGLIFFGWLALKFFQKIRTNYSNSAGKKLAKFCCALFFIACAEYVLPSSRLTGLDRPEPQKPAQYLNEVSFSDAPLTYDQVAKSAPWLWSLGTLTHTEMRNRLKEDLKIAQDRLDESDYVLEGTLQSSSYAEITDATRLIVVVKGTQAALENLDARFPEDLISGADATRFVYRQMAEALVSRRKEVSTRKQAVDEKIARLKNNQPNKELLDEDPEYKALKNKSSKLNRIISWSFIPGFELLKWEVAQDGELQQPSAIFPDFKTPISVFAPKEIQDHDAIKDIISGPRNSKLDMPADLMDAITGRKRNSDNSIIATNCAIGFHSFDNLPQLRKFCEFAVPLPLNYDLTAWDCQSNDAVLGTVDDLVKPGTQVSESFCKETWIHPHANIILSDDAVTIYPPKPVFAASQPAFPAPMSRWSVKVSGKEYDLEKPLVLKRNSNFAEQIRISFTHSPRSEVRNPRIWKDLRKPFPWTVLGREIMRAQKDQIFSSTTIEANIDARSVEDFWRIGEIQSK